MPKRCAGSRRPTIRTAIRESAGRKRTGNGNGPGPRGRLPFRISCSHADGHGPSLGQFADDSQAIAIDPHFDRFRINGVHLAQDAVVVRANGQMRCCIWYEWKATGSDAGQHLIECERRGSRCDG
jgi:hypothetical protein